MRFYLDRKPIIKAATEMLYAKINLILVAASFVCSSVGLAQQHITFGHGMSQPKGLRKQKLLDMTLGPVDESFLKLLDKTASQLFFSTKIP